MVSNFTGCNDDTISHFIKWDDYKSMLCLLLHVKPNLNVYLLKWFL